MTRFPIAFLMLALIGNPACCCATGAAETSGGVELAPTCCQEKGNEGTDREPGAPAPCPCAKRLCLLAGKKEVAPPPQLLSGAEVPPPRGRSATGLCVEFSREAKASLPAAISPEALPLRLLYGVVRC